MSGSREPRLALWLAVRRLRGEAREFAEGDLMEEFDDRRARDGDAAARRWLRRHALRCLFTRAPRPHERRDGHRAPHRLRALSGIPRDLAFAWRLMCRTPLVSAAAVLTFALGIGANAAIFSVAWPVLGARLPFPDESRLAFILLSIERAGRAGTNPISPGDYFDLLHARGFDSLAGFNMFPAQRSLATTGDPVQMRVGTVTEDFFRVLGVRPLLGRPLDARDFAGDARALVLDEHVWRRTFGADPAIVNSTVRMDGEPWTVVGVMPAGTAIGTAGVDAWSTQSLDRATARPQRAYFLAMIGRLSPGVTLDAANREMTALMRAVAERYPDSNRMSDGTPVLARAESFRERLTGPVRPVFQLLFGGAALVLLIAGINLTALQVARNLARRPEIGVRHALGAPRGVLVRQLVLESLTLAIAGGLAGLLAAALTLAALSSIAPMVAWYEVSPRLSAPVAIFTVALTIAAGLLVGLVPAVAATAAVNPGLPRARGGTASRATTRLRTGIVSAQVAMTVLLLIAATLTAASLVRVLRVDPGFEIDRGIIADVRAPGGQGDAIRFFDELVTRIEALPGVSRACAINNVPLDNDGAGMTFVAEGKTDASMQNALPMGITDGCFDALRIPLVRGRTFQRTEAESVAIVNETMAKALWPDGESPIGKRVHLGLVSGPLFTVVGVVRDIRATGLESGSTRQVWMSASRGWPTPGRLIVRTGVPPGTVTGPLRRLLAEMNADLALANVRTMRDIIGHRTAARRFVIVLLAGFAAIALALSAVGTYGMLSYQVGQRTREIGIRVALGARRGDVTRTLVAQVAAGVLGGVAAGIAGARLLSSAMAAHLFEMSPTDARVYLAVTAFVVIVAALACWSPLRRAVRVNPVSALRAE